MVEFDLPPEIQDVQERVAKFVREEVLPMEGAAEGSSDAVLERLRGAAKAAGLWNPHLPAEYGGLGLGPLGMAIVSQECGVSPLASLALNAMAPAEGHMHLLVEHRVPALARRAVELAARS